MGLCLTEFRRVRNEKPSGCAREDVLADGAKTARESPFVSVCHSASYCAWRAAFPA
jgi:hypothetical protein